MLSAFLLAASIQAQEPWDQPISLTCKAGSVETVLAKLSEQSGLSLTVSAPVSREIVILRVDKAPLADVMDKLAFACTAHWERMKGGARLHRSAKDESEAYAVHELEHEKWISKALAQAEQVVREAGPITQQKVFAAIKEWQNHQEEEEPERTEYSYETMEKEQIEAAKAALKHSPETRLVLRIARRIGVKRLAALAARDKSAVIANYPTRLQQGISLDTGVWSGYLEEKNATASAYEAAFPPQEDGEDVYYGLRYRRGLDLKGYDEFNPFDFSGGRVTQPPAKVILNIWPRGTEHLWVQCTFYNRAGARIGTGSLTLRGLTYVPDDEAPEGPGSQEPPLQLPQESLELAKLMQYYGEDEPRPKLSPETRQKLLRPDQFEPLGLVGGEVLVLAARQREMNLVACLPDVYFELFCYTVTEPRCTASDILDDLGEWIFDTQRSEGWLAVRPEDPADSVATRADRRALARVLASADRLGHVSLEDYAAYALACGSERESLLNSYVEVLLGGDATDTFYSDWHMAKLYGSFSLIQREKLEKGGSVRFQELSPRQLELVKGVLLEDNSGDFTEESPDEWTPEWQGQYTALALEPTEFLAPGLPTNGSISMTMEASERVEIVERDADGSSSGTTTSYEDLAMRIYAQTHPQFQTGDEQKIVSILPQTQIELEFRFQLAPTVYRRTGLSDTIPDRQGGSSLQSLSPSAKARVAAELKKIEERVRSGELQPPDQGIGDEPPPPVRRKPPPPRLVVTTPFR